MRESTESMLNRLQGRRIEVAEREALVAALPWAPRIILDLMQTYALAGARFTLDEADDESGLGVEMRWFRPDEIIDEVLNAYPGIAAASLHYLPVGGCLLGTGDPYFVRADAGEVALYRIPHTAVTSSDELVVAQVEPVSPSLEVFFSLARFR